MVLNKPNLIQNIIEKEQVIHVLYYYDIYHLLVIDVSKKCPEGQTEQHVNAQNKIDLINETKACQSYEQIREYYLVIIN